MGGVGRFLTAQLPQEREHPLAHHLEHRGRFAQFLEAAPAQLAPGSALPIRALREDAAAHGLLGSLAAALLQGFQLIQPPNEQQVGELLQNLQRVGDAATPEGISDPIDLVAQLAGEHRGRRGARGNGGLAGWGGGPIAAAAGAAGG